MGTTGINEAHEKTGTGATWQSDGLRDSDVLSTASLTNFLENSIYNGVVPITLTDYSKDSGGTDRNNPISGNACVRKNTGGATNSIFVDVGVACLDGVFYSVGNASAFNIDTSARYNARFNAGGMVLPTGVNQECWVLVIVDPELTSSLNNIGLVCGTVVDTSTGLFPQMPSSHLIKQSCILGAVRVAYGSPLVVSNCEDKRQFIRGGPIPLTGLYNSAGNGTDPLNDYSLTPALTAGNLPVDKLGLVYARNPAGFNTDSDYPHGTGQTHLFFQGDKAVGAGSGGAYQLTPVHRQAKETLSYTGAGALTLTYTPLATETVNTVHLITATWFAASGATMCPLKEGPHYAVSGKTLTFTNLAATVSAPLGPLGSGDIRVSYTHAGY